MARPITISEAEVERAKELRDKATTVADFRKALAVIISSTLCIDADKIAEILGTSRRTIFRNRKEIRNKDVTKKKPWGGRRRSSMAFEEESEFLSPWVEKAASGGILTVPPIHAALIKRLGHSVPLSTTYRLLARHGWRKVQPDTKHPKSDPVVQEDYKKNCKKLPLRLMFQDEARFGRMSDPRSSSLRPLINLALVREFRYEYAAVSPWDGHLDYMTAKKNEQAPIANQQLASK